jgi:RNA polymerase sigma-70 factor, ECF subfamily
MAEEARAGPSAVAPELRLDEVVAMQYPRLIRVAALICREPADAQDAVQAALERAWRQLSSVREPDRLEAWLHRIVVRESIRTERRRRGLLGHWLRPVAEIAVDATPVDGDLDLRRALDGLSPEQRAALVLHYLVGYSVADTAAISGTSLETTRSRLRLARARMRVVMGGSR